MLITHTVEIIFIILELILNITEIIQGNKIKKELRKSQKEIFNSLYGETSSIYEGNHIPRID